MLASIRNFCVITSEIAKKYSEEFFLFFSYCPFPSFLFLALFLLPFSIFCFVIIFFLIFYTEKVLFQHVTSENLAGDIPTENPDDLEFLICC